MANSSLNPFLNHIQLYRSPEELIHFPIDGNTKFDPPGT
jgi:hypothetical protein